MIDPALWPANVIERRKVADLVAYANNARTHSPEQIAELAASMREWGWTAPVLIDERDEIIAGHGRVLAAKSLGILDIPVLVARGWLEAQKAAYRLADNKLAEHAGWDVELLKVEVAELIGQGFDLGLAGFSDAELGELLKPEATGLTDPDAAPPLEPDPITWAGDVWKCGAHRVVCGDATDAKAVASALGGVLPTLMVTDPPYGVAYQPKWRNETLRGNGEAIGARAVGEVVNDDRCDWAAAWALFTGPVAYVWHSGLHAAEVQESLEKSRFVLRAQIVWVKSRHAISRGAYHWQHEPCFLVVREGADDGWAMKSEHELAAYAVRKGETGNWHGGRKQSTVWVIDHVKSETGHGTQKPVACMQRPIENNTSVGQAVYDPFLGSGTSLIAAQISGRCCLALEINPQYVDVAVKRWQSFTGLDARLESTGKTFAEMSSDPRTKTETDVAEDSGRESWQPDVAEG